MIEIHGHNVPEAYVEAFWAIKTHGRQENSRNGPVLTIPTPVLLTIDNPLQRVLFDPIRNANPFFHVMETIWMLAGSDRVGFPARFNRNYVNYAESEGYVHGAYGKRWRDHFRPKELGPGFSLDQIQLGIALLKQDPETRQVVIEMWDSAVDLGATVRDRPCNTHIYFRTRKSIDVRMGLPYTLDMTVCNRSNDLLWGMLGANVVHFSYLQEVIAFGAGMEVGRYQVFTNNLHVYSDRPDVIEFMKGPVRCDPYIKDEIDYLAILDEGEKVEDLLEDCENFLRDEERGNYKTHWIRTVAVPMILAWNQRVYDKKPGYGYIDMIEAKDWREVCKLWTERKTRSSAT